MDFERDAGGSRNGFSAGAAQVAVNFHSVAGRAATVSDEAFLRRKWASLYALCRTEELQRERARLEAEHVALVHDRPRRAEAITENVVRRALVAERLSALRAP